MNQVSLFCRRQIFSIVAVLILLGGFYSSLADEAATKTRVAEIDTRINEIRADPASDIQNRVRETHERVGERVQAIGQRIHEIRSTRSTANSRAGRTVPLMTAHHMRSIAYPGVHKGQLFGPGGLALLDQQLFVSEQENKRIQKFDVSGTSLGAFNALSPGLHEVLARPYGVAVGPDATVYVSDSDRHCIVCYSADGAYMRTIGSLGQSPGLFDTPLGIACDDKGNLYVADEKNARVQIFFPGENGLREVLREGPPGDLMQRPVDVTVGSNGAIYVLDSRQSSVFVFDARFRYSRTLKPETRWREPVAIATDSIDNLYVIDAARSRIAMFDPSGTHITDILINAREPRDIAISEDSVYISDQGTHTVQVYKKWGAP